MNLVIFYLILSIVDSFTIGLKQLKIISRVTKAKHLFDSALSSNQEEKSDEPYWLQTLLSKLDSIQSDVNEIKNDVNETKTIVNGIELKVNAIQETLDNLTKIWERNEPIFDQMNYLYERARAEELKSYRAK